MAITIAIRQVKKFYESNPVETLTDPVEVQNCNIFFSKFTPLAFSDKAGILNS